MYAARLFALFALGAASSATAQTAPAYETWPVLKSTFPSTGGGGMMIKGYDPVITGDKCITTFMAVSAETPPAVYTSVIEFKAVPVEGGILCQDGQWKSFDGKSSGTTPYRVFFKDGVFRGSPE